jgi:hypothetical protein
MRGRLEWQAWQSAAQNVLSDGRSNLTFRCSSRSTHGKRKKGNHHDPNDRRYDRQVKRIVDRLGPEEMDRLLRGEDG